MVIRQLVNNNILMNYQNIKPKREKYVTSLQYCDISNQAPEICTFIPCVVLVKDGDSQETFPVLRK